MTRLPTIREAPHRQWEGQHIFLRSASVCGTRQEALSPCCESLPRIRVLVDETQM